MQLSGRMKLISGFAFLDDQKSCKLETTEVIIAIYARKQVGKISAASISML